jgi:tetratricopeptide (TPR) repeat protein
MPLSNEGYIRALSVLLQIYPVESKHNLKESMLKEIKEYIAILEGKKDKDSEVFFILGKIWVLIGDTKKVDKYFGLALNYYPSSGYYIYEIAHYYASKGKYDSAMKVLRSFDPFIERHRGPHNPRGMFVYLIRDLEAEINYKIGSKVEALRIAQNNLQDAKNGIYVTTSARSRHFSSRESLLNSLKIRVEEYENNRS